ncbi:hypothetical protein BJX64DRAFT_265697 [Aspergillus heterothallicus]
MISMLKHPKGQLGRFSAPQEVPGITYLVLSNVILSFAAFVVKICFFDVCRS